MLAVWTKPSMDWRLASCTSVVLCLSLQASLVEAGSSTTTVESAARLFGAICQDVYPNTARARQTAEANGLQLDAQSTRFVHHSVDLQMRIDSEKCSIQFRAKRTANPPGASFAEHATAMIRNNNPGQVKLSSDWKTGKNPMTVVAYRNR